MNRGGGVGWPLETFLMYGILETVEHSFQDLQVFKTLNLALFDFQQKCSCNLQNGVICSPWTENVAQYVCAYVRF